jgi:diguanylate cyclase (GGDEF)-like protein
MQHLANEIEADLRNRIPTLEHDAGDEVLKQVAERLRSATRATDTVGRIGGDEFLLVITELQTTQNAAVVANKVLELLSVPIQCERREARVGASIGIATYPWDSTDIDRLIKLADEAMYKVKSTGKNGYRFAESPMRAQAPVFSSVPPG